MNWLLLTLWERWFGESIRKVEADSSAYRNSPNGQRADTKTITVLVTVAICLTIQNYTQNPSDFVSLARVLGEHELAATLLKWESDPLTRLSWWAVVISTTYTILPMLVITIGFRERLADYGLKLRGMFGGWRVYLVFVAVMVPLVWLFSQDRGFQQTYPFLPVQSISDVNLGLLRWELLYACQFLALEFFFRGFIVHGTKHRFGVYAIFVMMVPYCMIHFQKPLPECAASIIAGIALGLMSLKTRSIWLGAALHVSVAWGMDIGCLARRGLLEL